MWAEVLAEQFAMQSADLSCASLPEVPSEKSPTEYPEVSTELSEEQSAEVCENAHVQHREGSTMKF